MANRQEDVDLRFAQDSAPVNTLAWLGLAEHQSTPTSRRYTNHESSAPTSRKSSKKQYQEELGGLVHQEVPVNPNTSRTDSEARCYEE